MTRTPAIAAAALAFTLAGCAATADPVAPAGAPPAWTYEGPAGPEEWGRLSPEFELCETGRQGSPVDIDDAVPAMLGRFDVAWRPVAGEVVDTGHGIQVNVADAGGFATDDHRYDLLQFHFHTPAEHLLQGRRFPLEAHFVHRRDDGLLGVIGVFVEEGAANPVLGAVLDELAGRRGAAASLPIADLLPRDRDYYRYAGSLTTPPCTETVDWFVMNRPITASRAQIATLVRHYADNARPVQPLYRRFILRSAR